MLKNALFMTKNMLITKYIHETTYITGTFNCYILTKFQQFSSGCFFLLCSIRRLFGCMAMK